MKKSNDPAALIPLRAIERQILPLRGQCIILAPDLARLYGVPTKVLNQQVKRNADRFPADFMFRLTPTEKREVVTNCDHLQSLKFSAALPYAFTEHGAIMAATVLNTEQAVKVGLYVVRAFVKLREVLATHQQLAGKLDQLERKLQKHDSQIIALIDAIRQLMTEPTPRRKPIGYHTEAEARRR